MKQKQKEQINYLLQTASDRLKSTSGDTSAFNLLSALHMERMEARAHSNIIYYLLNDQSGQGPNPFLLKFLRVLDIPGQFSGGTWNVCRERVSDSSHAGRAYARGAERQRNQGGQAAVHQLQTRKSPYSSILRIAARRLP